MCSDVVRGGIPLCSTHGGLIDRRSLGWPCRLEFRGVLLGREGWVECCAYSSVRSHHLWAVIVPLVDIFWASGWLSRVRWQGVTCVGASGRINNPLWGAEEVGTPHAAHGPVDPRWRWGEGNPSRLLGLG